MIPITEAAHWAVYYESIVQEAQRRAAALGPDMTVVDVIRSIIHIQAKDLYDLSKRVAELEKRAGAPTDDAEVSAR